MSAVPLGPDSNSDRIVERFRSARRDETLAVLEGLHALKHALRFGARIQLAVALDPAEVLALARRLAPEVVARLAVLLQEISADRFADLAPRPPATGVIAIADRPRVELGVVLQAPGPEPIVFLEGATHLGNLGAAVRISAASGAAGLLASGIHDPWQPEALRGSAGLHFAVPVLRVPELPDPSGRPLIVLHPEGEPLEPRSLPPRALLAFGGERSGLRPSTLARADRVLRLPMRPGISSLNLATAVAATLYRGLASLP